MASLLENITKKNTSINDEIITNSMIASATASANMYLNAALTSSTPELRAMYSSSLSQIIAGHSILTDIVVKNGWVQPYNSPVQQLSSSYEKATNVLQSK
ncbi:spore coat protein [Clostridium pasteurianum DSM 525 = ATCC 6013]|uniref:Coat F domain protein n=1 Tax=Clostridium pasteurianum DSM 525 = ATCC 6013 TaxID=1262449 RepID=A0A0H3JBE7_CLOPA|nr:spore coat protein [Clostridium pasteurianum]AJA49600.1 spore coat protein [Clostridium pasteurianum DSM 525 = ATCC 6013]AJA53588.1 spore coat protein [Clostridium pasteurianum DSM 525 = ATCC 6013]AOZ76754.1 spore coat protein [Clostridium pasteurianum DSM 525 = ATCC 6013]AOZ80551.1 spore coat protein [Clostridium pasteurianum]ELP58884.1 spore coat protein [Clostridium pasteurianum DSM 525 = ATCC 6013]